MHNQPNGVRFEELARVLESNGYIIKRSKGSHFRFVNIQKQDTITIPYREPIKAIYIKTIIKKLNLQRCEMTVQDYMKLPYTKIITEQNDESEHYYFAKVLELEGCMTTGDTYQEVIEMLDDAMEGWLEVQLEHGWRIPLPVSDLNYSGKFVLRMPSSLHRDLSIAAKLNGVSLNQYILSKLSI